MNILVLSAGRRVKIVQYLQKKLSEINGNTIAADCDLNAPAIYFADQYEIVPRIDCVDYLDVIFDICEKHNITGIISLIDPELEILAKNHTRFKEADITLILSPLDMIEFSYDKQKTHDVLKEKGLPVVPTYSTIDDTLFDIDKAFNYPLVVKPKKGSASIGIETVYNQKQLINIFTQDNNLIIQPYYKDREFGIDVYIDMHKGHLVDMFIKEKLRMRSGETDKSISIHNEKIEKLVIDFVAVTNYRGPIDIDCFEYEGNYYISEINPRFGGGYPHAYECGLNYMNYIVENLKGRVNPTYKNYGYKESLIMMKYDNILIKEAE